MQRHGPIASLCFVNFVNLVRRGFQNLRERVSAFHYQVPLKFQRSCTETADTPRNSNLHCRPRRFRTS